MDRKDFIGISSSAIASFFLQAHTLSDFPGKQETALTGEVSPLIRSIQLQTTTPLAQMKKFYTQKIGLEIITESKSLLVIKAGESQIIFEYIERENYRPFYHFAFNIPENKIDKAFEWQRNRTPILHPSPTGPKDEITNFPHWNAHSIFFLDPAGNLLEYIARHDLDNSVEGEFSVNDILYVSEIGFVTDDVLEMGNNLMKSLEITQYQDGSSRFWPIGDEHGLLLMMQKGSMWVSNPGQVNETDIFKTEVQINKKENNQWSLPEFPYQIFG